MAVRRLSLAQRPVPEIPARGAPLVIRYIILLSVLAAGLGGQTARNVLVVVNQNDSLSRRIGDYYVHRRLVPQKNVCRLKAPVREEIAWDSYQAKVEKPISACLAGRGLAEGILYIVTTRGVPLKIQGPCGSPAAECAAVDSELALLYAKMKGRRFGRAGGVPNPFFGHLNAEFRHPDFGIYLVTRLTGYDFDDIRGVIDRSLAARNRGRFVIDLKGADGTPGNTWLRSAAARLPAGRVRVDESPAVLYGEKDVIGYASWGSNDRARKRRFLGFQWLPGAIATVYVSTNGRTFLRPPDDWNIGTWEDRASYFAGSPQDLTADYIHDGATGCSGHVYEPYLSNCPRPDYLLPAYYRGRNLAESYYLAIPSLSWQNIVVGDPLCSLGKPDVSEPQP